MGVAISQINKEIELILPQLHSQLDNDCLLVAANISNAVKAKQILKSCNNVKILCFEYLKFPSTRPLCHAVVVFAFPNNQDYNFYIYDEKIGTKICFGNLNFISAKKLAEASYPNFVIRKAFYIPN